MLDSFRFSMFFWQRGLCRCKANDTVTAKASMSVIYGVLCVPCTPQGGCWSLSLGVYDIFQNASPDRDAGDTTFHKTCARIPPPVPRATASGVCNHYHKHPGPKGCTTAEAMCLRRAGVARQSSCKGSTPATSGGPVGCVSQQPAQCRVGEPCTKTPQHRNTSMTPVPAARNNWNVLQVCSVSVDCAGPL